jgi:hypothetical protein
VWVRERRRRVMEWRRRKKNLIVFIIEQFTAPHSASIKIRSPGSKGFELTAPSP